ncbi:hypothetical protein O0L34_g8448 [Tuta absoluta]|nr:hypothetical protein O0L34_g8448 [Tuta absoluta]
MSHWLLLFLFGLSAAVSDWSYTKEVFALDGRPCITNCKNERCVVDFQGNYRQCNATDIPAPRYRTAELKQKKNEYCLSNCGFFGFEYEWCMVDNNKAWDYCNSSKEHRSVYKNACKEKCDKYLNNYYWCYIDQGSWQHCALPREDSSETVVTTEKSD